MKTWSKQPNDHLDYDLVLREWLPGDDRLTTIEIEAPAGIDVTGTSINDNRAKIWIEGGEDGQRYKFSAILITQGGREKEVDFAINVRDL